MSLFNSLLLIALLSTSCLGASAADSGESEPKSLKIWDVHFSYKSWVEKVELNQAGLEDSAFSQFYGLGVGTGYTFFRKNSNFGLGFGFDFNSGQANVGGSQTKIPYQKSNVGWIGASTQALILWRANPETLLGVGPQVVYRKIDFPDTANILLESGATGNTGALVSADYFLNEKWRLKTSLGFLSLRATTFWNLEFGYNL